MKTITPLTSVSRVGSSTSQGNRHSQGQQPPSQGQVVKALVIEAKGDNHFVLDIAGNRQAVRSQATLSLGQSLRLQVVKTEPQIELQVISQPINPLQGRSLTLLGKNIDLASLFLEFQQHTPPPLETVSPSSRSILESFFSLQQNGAEGKNGGVILKQLIDTLGLNLEQRLAAGNKNGAVNTLKAALLEIVHSFNSVSNIAETTNTLLATLELFQLTQLQLGNSTHLIFPLPLPFIEQGYLIIEQDEKDCTSNDSASSEKRFSLHLTVSDLGNLQIDFLKNLQGLFIRFRADDQEKADFIETFSADLKKAITDIPLINLSFSSDAPDPIHDLLRKLVKEGNSIVNTRI